ncbi:acyltransferase family protein [Thalassotalea sp. PLHSN55]|uniref:acyltransferase family protein n=1 Tax=Thalassotalea sp. PLHSN55 TaxID=3435888 RepID=UPI003F8677BD
MKNIPRDNHFIWIRYLAAFSILFSHSRFIANDVEFTQATGFFSWLFPGVPTLFFISGFLVSLSHNGAAFNVDYLAKRILRVFPPLWASVLLSVIALFAVGYLNPMTLNWGEFIFWFVGQLTVLQVYHPSFLDEFGIGVLNGSLWAIPVIFQFYLVLPFFVKIDQHFSKKYSPNWIYLALIFFALLNIAFNYFHNFHESVVTKVLFLTLVPWAFIFFLGYFFQRNFQLIKGKSNATFLLWLAIHIGGYLCLRELGVRWGRNDVNPILLVIFALMITNLAFLPKSNISWFNRIENFLKKYDITFGIFVYHVVVINFMLEYQIFTDNLTYRILCLVLASIVISTFSMLFLERPIRENRDVILEKINHCWRNFRSKKQTDC